MRFAFAAALVLALAAGVTTAVAACDSSSDPVASTLDPGPTFGIEVTVSVLGNGRVVSLPSGIDCPSSCFARITSADRVFDGSDLGLSLTPAAGIGAHFVGWTAQPLVSGTRARGPAECSPMKRNALGPPIGPIGDTIELPYGETQGTPPKGQAAKCADYTTVPVAYAVVATFEDEPAPPFFGQDAAPPGEVLFEPPALGVVVAREIGVVGDQLYFRYDQGNATSAIVRGAKDGKGGLSLAIAPGSSTYRSVSIGPNIVAQTQNLVFEMLNVTTLQRGTQTSLGVSCTSVVTDNASAYCRFVSGSQSFLYTWALDGTGFPRYIYTLPFGSDLAVDDANVYFTDVPFGGALKMATLETATKAPDASGLPDASKLVPGLNNPSRLVVTASDLLWLDIDESSQPTVLGYVSKTGADAATFDTLGAPTTAIAVDPTDPKTFYIGLASAGSAAQIIRTRTDGSGYQTFLYGLESVNGVAVDATYVYWTQNDGRVYRAPK